MTHSVTDDVSFFGVCCVFGTFAWVLFYFTFDLRAKVESKEEKEEKLLESTS